MSFDSSKNGGGEEFCEQPLEYWEESSYLLAVPKSGYVHLSDDMQERIAAVEGVTVKDWRLPDDDEPGRVVVEYDGEEYEAGFYSDGFALPEMFNHQGFYFTDDEITAVREADTALTVFMDFGADSKKSYHLQLKLIVAMVPDLVGIMDESAERLISARWARLAAESAIVPGPDSLFIVQAVAGDGGEVWLHTHGLNRCGLYELEIVGSDEEHYKDHYNVISTLASYMLDHEHGGMEQRNGAYIGMLNDQRPVVATYVSWTEALKEYRDLTIGGAEDRQEGHNSRTALVFIYKSEDDEKAGRLSKVSVYDDAWGDNPLFFISTEETQRMSALARERFGLVRYMAKNKECNIIIKIGLKTDKGDSPDDHEHIWFRLLDADGERFRAQLIQEPYGVSGMHEGDEGWYTVEDVTDWVIYLKDFSVMPNTAYLLV